MVVEVEARVDLVDGLTVPTVVLPQWLMALTQLTAAAAATAAEAVVWFEENLGL